MAVTTSLSRNVRRIGAAIRRYAATAGIGREHLAIAGVLDRRNERIYLNVGVNRPIDSQDWYVGIQQALQDELGYVPSFIQLGIVVRQVDDLDAFYDQIPVDDDDFDLTDWLSFNG